MKPKNSAIHVVETRRFPGDFTFGHELFTLFPITLGTRRFLPKEDECSDSDGETDPSTRRGLLGEFRKRHRFSVPMHHQPSDKVCAEILKLHAKRLFTAFPLKNVIVTLLEPVGSNHTGTRPGSVRATENCCRARELAQDFLFGSPMGPKSPRQTTPIQQSIREMWPCFNPSV